LRLCDAIMLYISVQIRFPQLVLTH